MINPQTDMSFPKSKEIIYKKQNLKRFHSQNVITVKTLPRPNYERQLLKNANRYGKNKVTQKTPNGPIMKSPKESV